MKYDWLGLLGKWDGVAISGIRRRRRLGEEIFEEEEEVLSLGTAFKPKAGEGAIARAEALLGRTLPQSLRSFYLVSNGWTCAGVGLRIGGAEEVGPFAESSLHKRLEPLYRKSGSRPVADSDYLVYGEGQRPTAWRPQYLSGLILLHEEREMDEPMLLLNPAVESDGNEWEAWEFSAVDGSVRRSRSFYELMQDLLRRAVEYYQG